MKKISDFLYRLISPLKSIFQASAPQKKGPVESIWADEDDEYLNQCMRYTKEFWVQYYNGDSKPEQIDNRPSETDPYAHWKQEFDKAVAGLDDDLKASFKLFMQGCTYKKIADTLQMDVETAQQRIEDARKKLREDYRRATCT